MGTKVAPSYVNLFMGALEEKLLSGAPFKPVVYYRSKTYSWFSTRKKVK